MIFEFRIKCKDENNNFALTIQIDEEQNFMSLHKSIQMCSSFETAQITSFFVSDNDWNRNTEITLLEMTPDILLMENTKINEYINNVGDKLIYLFDFFSNRYYKIELERIIDKKSKNKSPLCTQASGEAPNQIIADTELDILLDDDSDPFNEYDDDNIEFENIDDLDI